MREYMMPIAQWSAGIIELVGVAVIMIIAAVAIGRALYALSSGTPGQEVFSTMRMQLGRGILLGLEFLVAGDIIHTVAVELTFATVGVLAIVVLIRTFLSFMLEVEITGRWPWQQKRQEKNKSSDGAKSTRS